MKREWTCVRGNKDCKEKKTEREKKERSLHKRDSGLNKNHLEGTENYKQVGNGKSQQKLRERLRFGMSLGQQGKKNVIRLVQKNQSSGGDGRKHQKRRRKNGHL